MTRKCTGNPDPMADHSLEHTAAHAWQMRHRLCPQVRPGIDCSLPSCFSIERCKTPFAVDPLGLGSPIWLLHWLNSGAMALARQGHLPVCCR